MNNNVIDFNVDTFSVNAKTEKIFNMVDAKVLSNMSFVNKALYEKLLSKVDDFLSNKELRLQCKELLLNTQYVYHTDNMDNSHFNNDNIYSVVSIASVIKTLAYRGKVYLKLVACKSGKDFNIALDADVHSYEEFKDKYGIITVKKEKKDDNKKDNKTSDSNKVNETVTSADNGKLLDNVSSEANAINLIFNSIDEFMSSKEKGSYKNQVEFLMSKIDLLKGNLKNIKNTIGQRK